MGWNQIYNWSFLNFIKIKDVKTHVHHFVDHFLSPKNQLAEIHGGWKNELSIGLFWISFGHGEWTIEKTAMENKQPAINSFVFD